jgi:hypothetical protein
MLTDTLPDPWDPDAFVGVFDDWARERGLRLYPAQEEAVLEIVLGRHLVLSTPTGTGKSLVAVAAHAAALAQGRRSWYTAPIKALVSEKFFQLVEIFGAQNVGMVTGDSSVNPDAPILCCTAEILANRALRHGDEGLHDETVVMDEFHFYADPERGWAWQVPLLLLNRARFVLMSATLGDVSAIAEDLERRTGVEVAQVTGVERPVPLRYRYLVTPIHETIDGLLAEGLAPVYVVHFSQAAAVERAQALLSAKVATREQRDRIAEEIAGFRFAAGFGNVLSRLVRAGVGVHHAGMLPKYRRLVEQLALRGLLRVICGTDTLGVGINVPIRTVLLTGLTKFDGARMRQLSAREFHQIAGRAGRAGYDSEGEVVAEAPEHEIENAIAAAKAQARSKKQGPKKRAPEGFVSWGPASFERMIVAEPETLTSSMRITAAMMINVIGRPRPGNPGGAAFADVRALVFDNHEPLPRQRELARRAIAIYRTLRTAGVVEQSGGGFDGTAVISLAVDLPEDFALNQPLSPFALAAFELLDPASPEYPLDVLSVLEATLDDPRPVLSQQQFRARGEAVAAMKAEGVEYEQRMELLEEVSWPKPLAELLEQAFETFAASQPWVRDFELSPKSVVRDMWEKAFTFAEFVAYYQLGRSEGLVLRYLSDAYRAARQTIPDDARTPELGDVVEWLGEIVRQTDSSLLEEWEALSNPVVEPVETTPSREGGFDTPLAAAARPPDVMTNRRTFAVLVRNELWRRVRLAALQRDDELVALDPDAGWPDALDAYYAEHDGIGTDADARSARMVQIDEHPEGEPGTWRVRQVLADPAGDHDWGMTASVDLVASAEEGSAVLRVLAVDRLGG